MSVAYSIPGLESQTGLREGVHQGEMEPVGEPGRPLQDLSQRSWLVAQRLPLALLQVGRKIRASPVTEGLRRGHAERILWTPMDLPSFPSYASP